MIVVVPEAHALPPEATLATSPNFVTNVTPYLTKNQQAVDEELFHDIIPLIKARYTISDEAQERAIAGLSMGVLQAIETGIVHLGYFGWIGAFSPSVISEALSDEFNNALMEPEKINKNLLLFDIITGDNDGIVGKHVSEFEDRLKQAKVEHVYTITPGGTHSMFVWRPALKSFLEQIFRR
jgi:enterochelin esterase-like enzyme